MDALRKNFVMIEKAKRKLREAAEKKHQGLEIIPNATPFTICDDTLIFWYETPDQSSHIHTHLLALAEEII